MIIKNERGSPAHIRGVDGIWGAKSAPCRDEGFAGACATRSLAPVVCTITGVLYRQTLGHASRGIRKMSGDHPLISEASTGFEPVMRVLQTLALPLGHDALEIFRLPI